MARREESKHESIDRWAALESRRDFLKTLGVGAGLVGGVSSVVADSRRAEAQAEPFTDWGWPQPYTRASQKSVEWLQRKGMWPFLVGYQPGFPAWDIMREQNLLAARGLDHKFVPFVAGPPMNEALLGGRVHSAVAGDFPFMGMVARALPVVAISVPNPNNPQAFLVPKDSPLQRLSDLKGRSTQAIVGLVVGSNSEFLFQSAAKALGIQVGKDVILKNLPPAEITAMPRGVDLVVIWPPHPDVMQRKGVARLLEFGYPYAFVHNYAYLMREVMENASDVVQALTDAILEATLFARYSQEKAAQAVANHPGYDVYERPILERLVFLNTTIYKPTHLLMFPDFWSRVAEIEAAWLRAGGRLPKELSAAEIRSHYAPQFMERSVQTVGWKAPTQPPWLPATWSGTIGVLPYPEYYNVGTLSAPQPFPEPGDLARPWKFQGKLYQP